MSPYGDPRRPPRMTLADNGEGTGQGFAREDGACRWDQNFLPLVASDRSIRLGDKNGFA